MTVPKPYRTQISKNISKTNIEKIIESLEGGVSDNINTNADISGLVDSIIKTAMEKRASDIHIEPEENSIRVRYRIDGELVTAATIIVGAFALKLSA